MFRSPVDVPLPRNEPSFLPFLSLLLSLSSLSPSTHWTHHLLSMLVVWLGLIALLAVKDLSFSTFWRLDGDSTYYNLLFTHLLLSVLFANPVRWLLHSETRLLSLQVWLGILKTVTFLVIPRLFSTFPPIYKIFIIVVLKSLVTTSTSVSLPLVAFLCDH